MLPRRRRVEGRGRQDSHFVDAFPSRLMQGDLSRQPFRLKAVITSPAFWRVLLDSTGLFQRRHGHHSGEELRWRPSTCFLTAAQWLFETSRLWPSMNPRRFSLTNLTVC